MKEEKKKGNPIAGMIHKLKLDKNQITLLLTNNVDEDEEGAMSAPAQLVHLVNDLLDSRLTLI